MWSFKKNMYKIEDVDNLIICYEFTLSTSAAVGQLFTYTDCDGILQSDYIGGVGGYDATTICARSIDTYTVEITVINNGLCPSIGYGFSFSTLGKATSTLACDETTYPTTYYGSASTISIGLQLYEDINLSITANTGNLWYKNNNGISYRIDNDGIVAAYYNCVIAPTYYTKNISQSTPMFPCGSPSIPTTYPIQVFTSVSLPQINDYFYVSSDLAVGYPGDGTYYWVSLAFGYQIDSNGKVTDIIDCS